MEELAIEGEAGSMRLKEIRRGIRINLIVACGRIIEYQSTEKQGSLIPRFTEGVALTSSFDQTIPSENLVILEK